MIMIKNDSHKTEIKKKCLKKGQKKVCFYDHKMFKLFRLSEINITVKYVPPKRDEIFFSNHTFTDEIDNY